MCSQKMSQHSPAACASSYGGLASECLHGRVSIGVVHCTLLGHVVVRRDPGTSQLSLGPVQLCERLRSVMRHRVMWVLS